MEVEVHVEVHVDVHVEGACGKCMWKVHLGTCGGACGRCISVRHLVSIIIVIIIITIIIITLIIIITRIIDILHSVRFLTASKGAGGRDTAVRKSAIPIRGAACLNPLSHSPGSFWLGTYHPQGSDL